jgi:hypothetical protein
MAVPWKITASRARQTFFKRGIGLKCVLYAVKFLLQGQGFFTASILRDFAKHHPAQYGQDHQQNAYFNQGKGRLRYRKTGKQRQRDQKTGHFNQGECGVLARCNHHTPYQTKCHARYDNAPCFIAWANPRHFLYCRVATNASQSYEAFPHA